jgi:hypothetical protein
MCALGGKYILTLLFTVLAAPMWLSCKLLRWTVHKFQREQVLEFLSSVILSGFGCIGIYVYVRSCDSATVFRK